MRRFERIEIGDIEPRKFFDLPLLRKKKESSCLRSDAYQSEQKGKKNTHYGKEGKPKHV